MKTTVCRWALLGMALAGLPGSSSRAQVLWDSDRGIVPAEQGWDYLALGGPAATGPADGAFELDTTATAAIQAGMFRLAPAPLDRGAGFAVELEFALLAESHSRTERAGFSLIVLDQEARGIELAFQPDAVFAQTAEPLFTRGEEAAWPGGTERRRVTLTMRGERYRLHVDGVPILEGPVRAYWAFAGLFDVYETPNFLFLGDDTTSASARVRLWTVRLAGPPRPALVRGGDGGVELRWEATPGMWYGVERSRDLRTWERVATVEAGGEVATWPLPATGSPRFFRVTVP
ncbi:MAG: hypothetical protein D6766_08940 [Verrucomicrobia bacterium]|nr:MAG: hypothetical protein D6766_08940 [Verrucomicrobiota bacterium]